MSFYIKDCSKWWQGYKGEPIIVIDDWEMHHHVLGHHLKIWGDRYGFMAEVKGHGVYARPTMVIITSNYSIEDVFGTGVMADAIKRRYASIFYDCIRKDIFNYLLDRTCTMAQENFANKQ